MTIIDMHSNLLSVDDHERIASMRERNLGAGDPEECTVDQTLRRMDKNGIESAVVWKIGRSADECRESNDFIAEAASRYPDRFIPFATVFPPNIDSALSEIDRTLSDLRMAGIKVHPLVMDFDLGSPAISAIARRLKELDAPFVTHVNATLLRDLPGVEPPADDAAIEYTPSPKADPMKSRPAAEIYDSPRFQHAHMGGVHLDWVRDSNITFQTTGASQEVIQWTLDTFGSKRIVFGSDFPFYLVEDELVKITNLDATEEEKADLLSGNALTRVLRKASLAPNEKKPVGP